MTRNLILVIIAGFLLSSCISLLPEAGPGPDIYRLSKIDPPNTQSKPKAVILLAQVQVPRELKNNRVALMQNGQTIAYAANARWAAATPEMLQDLLADSLQANGVLQVVLPADGVNTAISLRVMLRTFEAEYDQGNEAAPNGMVSYQVRLIDRKSRSLVAEKTFTASRRASDTRLSSIVTAIDGAALDAAAQLADWVANKV
ncbi:hypothetical protein MNBD_ALPHA06-435 [hydrothermal vent metagenome]|uniref:ABC-type transport auxiliary lipoprotein component domain-containing protein n=1 Tax=hydrothermal vent metagenome TaxID=652676 RepID=A0A3B0S043_9ZZZZ